MEKTVATYCAVKWCVCLRVEGSAYCGPHKANKHLKPAELEPDEELSDGSIQELCDDCNGSGKCNCCMGTGDCEYKCASCYDYHSADCHSCDGDGKCPTCDGVKTTGVRKKELVE